MLIFIIYNVQLGLSQVSLGSLINRTEVGTASISIPVAPISVTLCL